MKWAGLLLLALAVPAGAAEYLPPVTTACNDLAHPGRSPGPQFEMFFNIGLPANVREEDIDLYPDAPSLTAGQWRPEIPEQPEALLSPGASDRKKLGILGGAIYYYEPDGKGGRRLCRSEAWASRTKVLFNPYVGAKGKNTRIQSRTRYNYETAKDDPYAINLPPQPEQTHNPVLARIAKDYVPIAATRFRYDTAGHLVEAVSFTEDNANGLNSSGDHVPTDHTEWRQIGSGECRLYRPDGRLWRYVSGSNSPDLKDCFQATRDTADYFEYRYDADGKLVRSIQNLAAPNDRNRWFQIWRMLIDGRQVEAEVDDVVGIRHITGAVNRIAPKDNNALNADGGVYFFPNHDAPVGILDDFSKIYDYQRVREKGGHIVRMLEAFPAGSSQLTARLWLNTANNTLLREEQYKNGKLVRAINTDFANDPVVHYYEEHLEKYKIKVKIKNLVDRVYEYDDKGNEKLVAISWTNVPKEEFYASPSPGRAGPLVDLAKDVKKAWQNRGKPKQPKPERLEFYYGLPDGTVKWKNFDEFQKAFNVHENADWLYPKGYPKRF
jgi:hypothetical protein